jgi:hypothetical protein
LQREQPWVLADEMRLGLHGVVRRVWAPRGIKVRQRRQIEYRWAYLAIAVDPVEGSLHWTWLANMRKETLAPVLGAWSQAGIKAVVWDSAGSHKAKLVRAVGVPLVYLPPYSPELNPAERVIEAIRAQVEGRVWASLEDKCERAEAFLRELAAEPLRVLRLAGWDWIQNACQLLPSIIGP